MKRKRYIPEVLKKRLSSNLSYQERVKPPLSKEAKEAVYWMVILFIVFVCLINYYFSKPHLP